MDYVVRRASQRQTAEPHVRLAACAKRAHYAGVKNRQRHGFNKARMEWTSISTTENG
ncbi:hypothetical protein IE4803_PA00272 (plasmid) [Rhizobium etli bv. phaseoli str. IE4803]|nr:hypothetical protein IE4803_PA00272 [Rhizobium etli bv. phaseoli str. IE4803]